MGDPAEGTMSCEVVGSAKEAAEEGSRGTGLAMVPEDPRVAAVVSSPVTPPTEPPVREPVKTGDASATATTNATKNIRRVVPRLRVAESSLIAVHFRAAGRKTVRGGRSSDPSPVSL